MAIPQPQLLTREVDDFAHGFRYPGEGFSSYAISLWGFQVLEVMHGSSSHGSCEVHAWLTSLKPSQGYRVRAVTITRISEAVAKSSTSLVSNYDQAWPSHARTLYSLKIYYRFYIIMYNDLCVVCLRFKVKTGWSASGGGISKRTLHPPRIKQNSARWVLVCTLHPKP